MPDGLFVTAIVLCGVLVVTLIDAAGSIASKRLRFNYALLTPFSLAVYTLTGYLISARADMQTTLIAACIVGIYDASVGWKIALALDANMGAYKAKAVQQKMSDRIIVMIGIAGSFAYIGYQLAGRQLF